MRTGNHLVIKRIVEAINQNKKKGERFIITIDGTSGVGKSTIAEEICSNYKNDCCLIKADTLLVGYGNRYRRMRVTPFDYEDYIVNNWFNKLTKII